MADLLDIILGVDTSQIKTAKQEIQEFGNSFTSATKSAYVFEQAISKAIGQAMKEINFFRDRVKANQDLINSNLGVSNSYKSAQQSASAFSVVLGNLDKVAKATIADFNDRVGITGFFKSAEQSASSFEVILNNIDKQAKSFTAAFNQRVGVTGTRATDNGAGYSALAAQAAKEEAAARELIASATKREADQLEYLNMKYDKAYAAAKLYKSVQDEINLAMSKGVGNADQLQAQLNKLEMEYAAFGAGTTDIKNRFVQQAAAVQQSRQGINKYSLLVQQTGYQVGDFLVQIQSGTNAFVAFGQQATQLVGILPSFADELGISALALGGITLGLSIAIPLLTAIGAYFTRTSKNAKDATDGIVSYADSIKNLSNELNSLKTRVSEAKFGVGTTAEADALQKIADLNLQIFKKKQEYLETDSLGTRQRLAEETWALQNQASGLQVIVDQVEQQREALRKVNNQIVENTHQHQIYYESLKKAANDQAIAEQEAADKATFLKNVFHAMAGEAGAISTSLDGWAGKIIAATEAAKNFKPMDYSGFTYGGAFAESRGAGGAGMIPTNEGTVVEDKTATGTGGGGGMDKVQALLDSLQTQTEVVDAWYEESQKTLQSASDKELEIIGGRHEAELRLEIEHQQKMAAIKEAVKQNNLSIVLGSGAQILSALGAHNEKAAKMAKIFGAAQALADTYVGAAAALKLPFPANLAAAASIISAGLGFVAAIKSGGTASASGGGGGKSVGSVPSSTTGGQTAAPQVVMIQGLKPTDVFTGEQLSTLFDSLYKENRNRGMVFQVAR